MYKLRMFLLRTFKPTTYKRYASMLLWKVFIKPQREQNMITSAIDRAFGESAKNLTTPNKDYFDTFFEFRQHRDSKMKKITEQYYDSSIAEENRVLYEQWQAFFKAKKARYDAYFNDGKDSAEAKSWCNRLFNKMYK